MRANLDVEKEKRYQLCDLLLKTDINKMRFNDELVDICIRSLSFCYYDSKDICYLKALNNMILNSTVSIEAKVFIYWQIKTRKTYYLENYSNEVDLSNTYKNIYNCVKKHSITTKLNRISKNEQNENVIVLITNQFLDIEHSPTKLLLNIVRTVDESFLDIDSIYIFNSAELTTKSKYMFVNGFKGRYVAYNSKILENILEEAKIIRCGVGYEQNEPGDFSIDNINNMAKQIYALKPKYIFNIGGDCLLADICNDFKDVVTIPLSADIPTCFSKYIVKTGITENVQHYKLNKKQEALMIPFNFNVFRDLPIKHFTREKFDLRQEDFLISVVGNRLNIEISDDFLELCSQLLKKYSHVGIVFIGEYNNRKLERKLSKEVRRRCYCIGYQSELSSILELTNVYLNPKREGGGYSSIASISRGVPVISIDYGDVAMYLSEEFKAKNYKEIEEIISKMIEDEGVYKEMCRITEKRFKAFNKNNWKVLIDYMEQNL